MQIQKLVRCDKLINGMFSPQIAAWKEGRDALCGEALMPGRGHARNHGVARAQRDLVVSAERVGPNMRNVRGLP